ncbi:MAG: ABC transporter ATP-binding protein [Chloroflexi bacterium]|nr:ABC transporter ATP-binding protein [Chloroflexota bacterium]
MIEIAGLSKSFNQNVGRPSIWRRIAGRPVTRRVTALKELNLKIGEGEFFSLLGPNGAGKTTAIRILCTLLLPDAGVCRVAQHDVVKDARAVRRMIGVSIRGERSVNWKLTGRQNFEYFASLYGLPVDHARDAIKIIAEIVELADRLDDYVETYSMGMKQRLAIGVSLVHSPRVLLLDEPTIGLDPNGGGALRALLKTLVRGHGVTVLYTTHYMHEAEELSDRLAIINNGEKVIEGSPSQVRETLGDGRVVELQVARNDFDVRKALTDHPAVEELLSHDSSSTLDIYRVKTRDEMASVATLIADDRFSGADIKSINQVRPSLEDVFVSLTGSTITENGDVRTV